MTFENALLGASMAFAISAGIAMVRRHGAHRMPFLTLAVALLTIAGFVLQLANTGALEALQRNSSAIAEGQWWRLFTTLLVQDGGWAGFLSNLAGLVLVGALAEQLISRWAWIGLYFVPALAVEINSAPLAAGRRWQLGRVDVYGSSRVRYWPCGRRVGWAYPCWAVPVLRSALCFQ